MAPLSVPSNALAVLAIPARRIRQQLRPAEAGCAGGRKGTVVCAGVQSRILGMRARRVPIGREPIDCRRCDSRMQPGVRDMHQRLPLTGLSEMILLCVRMP